jgi:homoserine O-acetyltransferase
MRRLAFIAAALLALASPAVAAPPASGHDFTIKDFRFHTGETLPEVRIHYDTIGAPHRDASGAIDNAVLLLHGTGGSGKSLQAAPFADVLMVPGGLLDPAKTFIILPDDLGHGRSSKPSDGLRTKFPKYDYADMVEAEHALVTQGLGIRQLRLVLGTSMGCMHAFMWGETWPDASKALMPLACLPVEIAGRNRMWRKMAIDAITSDPAYKGGDYTDQPVHGLAAAVDLLLIAGSAPLPMQLAYPTRGAAEAYLAQQVPARVKGMDANDFIYQVDASRTYDPSKELEKITAPLTWVNSADDFINPPELGIAEREVKRIPNGRFVLIPASEKTHGHGTHTWAAVWQDELKALLDRSR